MMTTLLNYGFTKSLRPGRDDSRGNESEERMSQRSTSASSSALCRMHQSSQYPSDPNNAAFASRVVRRRAPGKPSHWKGSIQPTAHTFQYPETPKWGRHSSALPITNTQHQDRAAPNTVGNPVQLSAALLSQPTALPPMPSPSQIPQSNSVRVQQIRQTHRIQALVLPGNQRAESKHSTRNSISLTPISAYAGHNYNNSTLARQTELPPAPPEGVMALAPIELDLGVLEVIASLSETSRPFCQQSAAKRFLRKNSIFRPGSRTSALAVELPSGSIMSVITPEQSAWQRAPYIPGTIKLQPLIRTERSPLAIIQETVEAELEIANERLLMEQSILDELARFIESFGEEFRIRETSQVAFWFDGPGSQLPQMHREALLPPLSLRSNLTRSELAVGMLGALLEDAESSLSMIDVFGDLEEPEFIRSLLTISSKRTPGTSSVYPSSSPEVLSPQNSHLVSSPASTIYPNDSSVPIRSQGVPERLGTDVSPRKVRQVKGKGASSSSGQKMSLRGLLRSAASIV